MTSIFILYESLRVKRRHLLMSCATISLINLYFFVLLKHDQKYGMHLKRVVYNWAQTYWLYFSDHTICMRHLEVTLNKQLGFSIKPLDLKCYTILFCHPLIYEKWFQSKVNIERNVEWFFFLVTFALKSSNFPP